MSLDFDQLPLYDPVVGRDGHHMSEVWRDFLASFSQTLGGYLSQSGIGVPPNTQLQRNDMKAPIAGQLIYNTTTNKLEYYNGTAWVSLP